MFSADRQSGQLQQGALSALMVVTQSSQWNVCMEMMRPAPQHDGGKSPVCLDADEADTSVNTFVQVTWLNESEVKREGVSSAGGHTSSLQHKSSVFLFYHNTLEQRGHLRWRRDESTPHGGEILVFVFFFEQNDCCTPHAGTSHIKGSQTITPLDKHRPLCCYVIISKFVVTEKSSHPWLGWTNPGAHWGVLEQGTYSLPAAVETQWPTDRSTGGLGGCRRHERPHRCSHAWKMLWMCPVGWCNMSPLYATYIFPPAYMWCPFTYSTPDPQASCVCRCIRRWMCWASSRCGRAERSHTPQFWEIHSLSARETTTDKLDRISEILLLQTDF